MDKTESPLTCEGCIHAIVETEQSGCAFNLLGMLNAQKFDKFYILDRTCLVKNKTPEDVDIKLGYLFILKDFKDLPVLESNILAIKDSNPLWIGVSTNDPTKNYQVIKILESALEARQAALAKIEVIRERSPHFAVFLEDEIRRIDIELRNRLFPTIPDCQNL
jgi:hypothetical protein